MTAFGDTVPSYARTMSAPQTGDNVAVEARPPAPKLHVDIIQSLEGLADLGEEWSALFERCGRPHQVFQTFGFASVWVGTYLAEHQSPKGSSRDCACQPAVVTVRDRGRLVLVWPMVLQRQFGSRVLTWLGEPVAQYGDVIADPAYPIDLLLDAALEDVCAELRPDVLRLRKVRADAAIAPFLDRLGAFVSETTEAPCVTLAAGGSAVDGRQSGKAKKNRRRLTRRLQEQGAVAFVTHCGDAAAADLARHGIETKRTWLLERGHASTALGDPRFGQFFARATTADAQATGCRTFALMLDGKPVAVAIGFECKRRLMLHLITHTAEVERFGTGILNLEAILHSVEAEGLEALDLLPPKADYKLDWADTATQVADRSLGLTMRGRLLVRGFDTAIRPFVKNAIERLPIALRQRLARRSLTRVTRD